VPGNGKRRDGGSVHDDAPAVEADLGPGVTESHACIRRGEGELVEHYGQSRGRRRTQGMLPQEPAEHVARAIGGATIERSEGGAMVSMNDAVEIMTDTQGGIMRGLKRSMLGGESFFMNTFTAQADGAELWLAPALAGDVVAWPITGTLFVQSGSFLASSQGLEVDSKWGGSKTFFSREGLFMLRISGQGLHIGEPLRGYRGIPTGVPQEIDSPPPRVPT